jgi:hypothetical protein
MLSEDSKKSILNSVNANSLTSSFGVLVIDDERTYWLRRIHDARPTMLFRVIYEHKSKLPDELLSLGLNATGAVCAWVGAFAFSTAAPISGGTSVPLAYVSAAAAGAGTVQTFASGYRVYNELSGNSAANEAQDNDACYMWTMRSCDILQLVSAGAGIKTAATTVNTLQKARVPLKTAVSGVVNNNQIKKIAIAAGLGQSKTAKAAVSGVKTAAAVKQQLLGAFSSALSGVSSITGGVIKEIAIGVCGDKNYRPPEMQEGFVGPIYRR